MGKGVQSKASTPCLLLLDSMQVAHAKQMEPGIRKYIPWSSENFHFRSEKQEPIHSLSCFADFCSTFTVQDRQQRWSRWSERSLFEFPRWYYNFHSLAWSCILNTLSHETSESLQVPQQRDNNECGYYVLYYISRFLELAPEDFSLSDGYPYFVSPPQAPLSS